MSTADTIDTEYTEVEEEAMKPAVALVHRPPKNALEIMGEIISPESLKMQQALSQGYDDYCRALLSPNDVQAADGKEFKKKSAWRKLGRAFRVSTEVVSRKAWWEEDEEDRHLIAEYTVRASAPWGQYADAVGVCSTRESRFYSNGVACPNCGGPTWDNRNPGPKAPEWKRNLPPFTCKDKGCKGAVHDPNQETERRPNPVARAKADHDVRATAETRATNRAISNLIAAGEVSYEELDHGAGNGGAEGHAEEPPWEAGNYSPPPEPSTRKAAPANGNPERKAQFKAAVEKSGMQFSKPLIQHAADFARETFHASPEDLTDDQYDVLLDWIKHQMDLPPDYLLNDIVLPEDVRAQVKAYLDAQVGAAEEAASA